jgi:hypothetical protein
MSFAGALLAQPVAADALPGNGDHEIPENLIASNRMLVLHDVYRMATIAEGEAALVTGKESDDFLMEANDPFDGLGRIPTSTRSIQNGDALPLDRWPGLTEWHAGLSCLTQLYPNHGIAMVRQGQCDADFLADFNRPRQQNSTIDGRTYRVMRVYRLARGTMIPTGIGIERDGDGRASLFPITEPATVSKVAGGHVFVFDEVETNLVLVLESDEGNAHSIDRFDTTLPSGAEIQPAGSDIRDSTSSASEPITESNCGLIADMTGGKVSKAVCDVFQIDASTRQSFVVSVSEAEKQSLLQQCRRCIGFTEGQSQCKNQCITNSQWPWCHSHVDQERDFATFRSTGSRPHWCGWWPDAQHIFA